MVEGWEDNSYIIYTLKEVENRAMNIVRKATYNGGTHISLGWKEVTTGCIELTFILLESVKFIPEKLAMLEDSEVVSVQVNGDTSIY